MLYAAPLLRSDANVTPPSGMITLSLVLVRVGVYRVKLIFLAKTL